MIDQIMTGLIGMGIGMIFIVYARKLVQWFGPWPTFEEKLGSGGSYTAMRLIGTIIGVISFLIMTGLLESALIGIIRAIGFGS